MGKITTGNFLWGTRHWALWSPYHTPAYKVYRYYGASDKYYYFQPVGTGTLLLLTKAQLFDRMKTGSFTPFCIDSERIADHFEGDKNANI